MIDRLVALLQTIPALSNTYVLAFVVFLVFVVLSVIVVFIFKKYLERFAAKTKTKVDDLIFERTKKPLIYLIIVYGAKVSLEILAINGVVTNIVNSAMAAVFLFILLRVCDVIIGTWGNTLAAKTETNLDEILLPLFHKALKVIFFIVGMMWILNIWGIDITPYLAGVGISGLIIGLALQDSLKNILGGVSLLLDETFVVGDKVKLENGVLGTIHDIGLRSTKIVSFDNEIIYVPNGYLANSMVQNYTRPSPRVRTHVKFGVEYGSDVKQVQAKVVEVLKSVENVLNDPAPNCQFLEMADSALSFQANFWVENWGDAWSTKLAATEAIYNGLNAAGIGIPYPTQTIHLKKE